MANITGTAGSDSLTGTSADDVIDGLDGNDYINGGFGNDDISGGEGDDYIISNVGSDEIDAGAGDDRINIDHRDAATTTVLGGAGNDYVQIMSWGSHSSIVDAGSGDDFIEMTAIADGGSARLTVGAGRDILQFLHFYGATTSIATGSLVVTDFETGANGDRLDWIGMLTGILTGWDGAANPFATGHVKLVQDGAHALLQIDRDGGANGFVTFIKFENVSASAFTLENLDGLPIDGTIPAGLALTGTEARDRLVGAAGADVIDGLGEVDDIQGGMGDDTLRGGAGNDQLYGELGVDRLEGGADSDYLDGGRGDDMLLGGEGDDYLTDLDGDDILDGGEGNDHISLTRGSLHHSDLVTGIGGAGNDMFWLHSLSSSRLVVDAGPGNDLLTIFILGGLAEVSLGEGVDTVHIREDYVNYLFTTGSMVISDFKPGVGGDIVVLEELPHTLDFDNPFASGGLRLIESGSDTLLQEGWHSSGWRTIITFKGVAKSSLVAENFGGFPPDGSSPPGKTIIGTEFGDYLHGTAGADTINGLGEQDFIYAGTGGDQIDGGAGNDGIYAGAGDDTIYAGDGDDNVDDGRGDDFIDLGAGNDSIHNNEGMDIIYGGDGNDTITAQRQSDAIGYVYVFGGAGADDIYMLIYNGVGAAVDAGSGDDKIRLAGVIGNAHLTLGTGSDTLDIGGVGYPWYTLGTITVSDFETGAQGDRFVLNDFLASTLLNWSPGTNPFATGHLRFAVDGNDVRLLIDRDGGANSYVPLLTLQNVDIFTLIASNVGGYDPVTRGTSAADQMSGTVRHDLIAAGDGADFLQMQQGGDDAVSGGPGNDAFYFGTAYTAGDFVDGGIGRDQVALQGNYALTLGTFTGVEDLILLSGTDTRFGDPGTGLYNYAITSVDGNVAAGATLLVDGSQLVAGESFTFNGSAESNGKFILSGGNGVDTLTGGAGADGFYFRGGTFWGPSDKVTGGANDQIGFRGDFTGANKVVMGADQIAGIVTLVLMSGTDTRFGGAVPPTKFDIQMHDGNVGAGQRFTIDGFFLGSDETMRIDGSAEQNGFFRMVGGAGADILIGGAGNDSLRGNVGSDTLTGNGGADSFVYRSAAESTGTGFDLLIDLKSAEDLLDLHSAVTGWNATVGSGQLSQASFDADLAAALDGALDPGKAILFDPNAGTYAGRHFLVVDANGDGAYTAGADYVFELGAAVIVDTSGAAFFV